MKVGVDGVGRVGAAFHEVPTPRRLTIERRLLVRKKPSATSVGAAMALNLTLA
jgi:hypothetical protein